MSLAGHQINLIDVNFHLQNFFDKNSVDKKGQGGEKYPPSCQLGLIKIPTNLPFWSHASQEFI